MAHLVQNDFSTKRNNKLPSLPKLTGPGKVKTSTPLAQLTNRGLANIPQLNNNNLNFQPQSDILATTSSNTTPWVGPRVYNDWNSNRLNFNRTRQQQGQIKVKINETKTVMLTVMAQEGSPPITFTNVLDTFFKGNMRDLGPKLKGARMIRQDKGLHLLTFNSKKESDDFTEKFKVSQYLNDGAGTSFSGKVIPKEMGKTITLYPIPFELENSQINNICHDELRIETPLKVTYGHHRNYPNLLNGFLHLKLRESEIQGLPEVLFINERPVTVLKPGEKLYRPCKICLSRKHEMPVCPHLEEMLQRGEKRKKRMQDAEVILLDENNDVFRETSVFSPDTTEDGVSVNLRKRGNTGSKTEENIAKHLKGQPIMEVKETIEDNVTTNSNRIKKLTKHIEEELESRDPTRIGKIQHLFQVHRGLTPEWALEVEDECREENAQNDTTKSASVSTDTSIENTRDRNDSTFNEGKRLYIQDNYDEMESLKEEIATADQHEKSLNKHTLDKADMDGIVNIAWCNYVTNSEKIGSKDKYLKEDALDQVNQEYKNTESSDGDE